MDAIALARLLRRGHLTPVEVPSEEQEAIRGLVRYRFVLEREAKRTKNRVWLAQGTRHRD